MRLYDELGLLRPVEIDEHTGYRWYAPEQLERARLVAWLRRIGMPLARIAAICPLPPTEVAAAVTRYWRQVEAEHAARGELVLSLVRNLLGDRYLLRTDGLYLPIAAHTLKQVLTGYAEPEAAVAALAELVQSAGAPDNVVCIVADVLPARAGRLAAELGGPGRVREGFSALVLRAAPPVPRWRG